MKFRLGSALLLAGLTAGCVGLKPVEDTTRYYLLPEVDVVSEVNDDAVSVGLHPLTIPSYLERREIAVQQGPSEIVYLNGHRWVDGLGASLQRSLAQHLQAQPTIREVASGPWARPGEFERTIAVRIEHCQGHEDVTVRLVASWQVEPSGKRGRANVTGFWAPGDVSSLAKELGRLVGQVAAAIAQDL